MNWLNARLVGALVVFVLCLPAAAAATRQYEIDRLVTKYSQLRQFNGTVLLADEKGVVFKKGYGSANFEWQVPNTPDTKFRIGSITKQFTSMLILQLVAEGKLQLDDTLTKHLPDYRKDTGDRVTLTHLLNHTSGIPSYTSLPDFMPHQSRDPYTVAAFVKKFASGDLEFEPGTKFAYNNSGYYLLGAIIEKVTGKPYAQVLRERILDPLGMKNTGYDVSATVLPKRASGYELKPEGYVNADYLDMTLPYAAGSMYSTVEDLYLWDRALYGDALLPAPLKQQLFKPGLRDYGFGWFVGPLKLADGVTQLPTVSHGGGINGFSTLLIRVPERKELVILLDNTARGDKLHGLAVGVLSILHGIAVPLPKQGIGDVVLSTVHKTSVAEALTLYRTLKATKAAEYDFSEGELNAAGYRLLEAGRPADAIALFTLNVEMFPKGADAHYLLGEAHEASGDTARALASYRRSLELKPGSPHAARALLRLEKPATAVDAK
jgi:CubicO group peptidase (beta-lactamase class C family)